MRFAREAWPFVLVPLVAALTLAVLGFGLLALGSAVVAVALLLFFRDPQRRADAADGEILAPAFGKVLRIEDATDDEVDAGALVRVVTFLSVFDVHLQRVPCDGRVVRSRLRQGRRLAAFHDLAGEVNEEHLTVFERANGDRLGVRQIVGMVARRIVCYLSAGDRPRRGDTMGLIKFGSRVDLLVPSHYEVLVAPGDRLRGGQTIVAREPANHE